MKMENIIKNLEKMGYEIESTKFDYWAVSGVKLKNGEIFAIADGYTQNGSYGVIEEFKLDDVISAIQEAEENHLYREDCRIYSMADYFHFKSRQEWEPRVKVETK